MAGKQGKKSKKAGRQADECKAYRGSGRLSRNKVRKMQARLKTHPNDKVALEALKKHAILAGIKVNV